MDIAARKMLTQHPTGLQSDQLYTRLFRNIYESSNQWQEGRYQGHYWRQVEHDWKRTREWFDQCKTFSFPPFLGLSLHMQRLDDMDKVAWQKIEEQEVARVQTWRTKQGVHRKKLLPDVRDDQWVTPLANYESYMGRNFMEEHNI